MANPQVTYWDKRKAENADRIYNRNLSQIEKEYKGMFATANGKFNRDIQDFYNKYGVVQKSPIFKTLPDGSQVISGYSNKTVVPPEVAAKGKRLANLQKQLNDNLAVLAKEQYGGLKNNLSNAAADSYYGGMYSQFDDIGMGTSFQLLSKTQLESLVRNPVHGANFSELLWDSTAQTAKRVNQTVRNGVTQGLSYSSMAKELQTNLGGMMSNSMRLARTEMTNSMAQGDMLSYQNSGIVKGYRFLAILDGKTSDICVDMDGEFVLLEDAVTGLNLPPLHPYCRSTTTADFGDSDTLRGTRVAVAEDGSYYRVPDDMNAKDWRAIYVDKTMDRDKWDLKHGYMPKKIPKKGNPVTNIATRTKVLKGNHYALDAMNFNDMKKYADQKLGIKKFGGSTLDDDVVREFLKGTERIVDDFPEYANAIVQFGASASHSEYAYHQIKGSTSLGTTTMKRKINVSTKLMKDPKTATKYYANDVASGFHPANTTWKDIMIHENMHGVESMVNFKKLGVVMDKADQTYTMTHKTWMAYKSGGTEWASETARLRAFKTLNITGVRDSYMSVAKVSKYSLKNSSETLAEAAADVYANGLKANVLSQEIMKEFRLIYQEVFKP